MLDLVLAVSVSLAISAMGPSRADDPAQKAELMQQCTADVGAVKEDVRIAACTAIIDSGSETGTKLAEILFWRANAYGDSGDYEKAIADYTRGFELAPDAASLVGNRGLVYMRMEDYPNALADFSKALELDPEWTHLYSYRSSCYLNLENFPLALADAEESIRRNPKEGSYYVQRGQVHLALKDTRKAIDDVGVAFELGGLNDAYKLRAYLVRTDAYEKLGEYQSMVKDLDEAIALDPKNAKLFNARCWARATWGQELGKAMADCDAAIAMQADEYTHGSRGFLNMRRADPWAAITDFTASLAINPDHAFALYGRGVSRLRVGQTEDGQADIVAGISRDPDVAARFAKFGLTP